MANDYISREKALRAVDSCFGEYAHEAIEGVCEADVEPIVHARWLAAGVCGKCGEQSIKGLDAMVYSAFKPKYCPNCGARMDREAPNAD